MANDKEAKSKKDTKNKKSFFKDFKAELKKVIWPTPKQLVNNTVAVVVIVLVTALIVFVLDVVFDLFNKYGINRLKANVRGYNTVQVEDEHNHESENTTNETEVNQNAVDENTETNNVVEENNTAENQTVSE